MLLLPVCEYVGVNSPKCGRLLFVCMYTCQMGSIAIIPRCMKADCIRPNVCYMSRVAQMGSIVTLSEY